MFLSLIGCFINGKKEMEAADDRKGYSQSEILKENNRCVNYDSMWFLIIFLLKESGRNCLLLPKSEYRIYLNEYCLNEILSDLSSLN